MLSSSVIITIPLSVAVVSKSTRLNTKITQYVSTSLFLCVVFFCSFLCFVKFNINIREVIMHQSTFYAHSHVSLKYKIRASVCQGFGK